MPAIGYNATDRLAAPARTVAPKTLAPPLLPPVPPRQPGSDIQSSGAGYGSARANAYKATPAYRQAIVDVYRAQPPAQKLAIVRGAARSSTPEGQIIRQFLALHQGPNIPNPLTQELKLPVGQLARAKAAGFPIAAASAPNLSDVAGLVAKVAAHTGSDLYHLPGNTVQGLYAVGNELVNGHLGNAFHMLTDPYVQFFNHPGRTFVQHPLNTGLMFLGPKAIAGRLIGGAGRAAGAEWASTAREPLRLPDVGGFKGPPIEARSFSRDVFTAAAQKAVARARGEAANITRRPVAKIRRIGNEMTAVRQMVGRTTRGYTMRVLMKAAPHEAVRNVVTHILQGVVRGPETAIADMHQEIARLQPFADRNLRKPSVVMARAQIRDLQRAIDNPQHLPGAFQAAADIRPHLHASDAYLTRLGLLDSHQALRRAIAPYAMAHMGARFDHTQGRLRIPDAAGTGLRDLPTQEILDHLRDNHVPDPAYVGHYPSKVAPWRFYSAYRMARGSLGKSSTFEAFRSGAYDHTYKALAAQGARTAEAITKAGLQDRVISRFGVVRPDGRDFTPAEAQAAAHAAMYDENGVPKRGAIPYVAMTRAPQHALDFVKNLQHPHELTDQVDQAEVAAVDRAIQDAASRSDSTRNVVLVPKAAVDQFRAQFEKQGGISREMGRFTQQFRRTVLPYSTHWMFQIGTEAALRGLLGGVMDPRNLIAGHQLMHYLENDPAGQAALAEMAQAVFYNQHENLGIYHDANRVAAVAKAAPISRQLIAAHNGYADFVGHAMTRFEREFRVMGLGKLARQQVQEFTGSWQGALRVQGQNLATLAGKLKSDPNLVAKFGRRIDEVFGKYNKFAPKTRGAIQSFAPFLPWYLNAARYVLWNLPKNHPVASSLLASLRQTINQDVQDGKQQPLDEFSAEQLARLSPFGIGAYPTGKGESPVGAMLSKDVAGVFLPQIEGSIYNLAGVSSFGTGALKGPSGDVKPLSGAAVRAALENAAEAFLPGVRYAREAREGTTSSYGTSTLVQPQGKGGDLGAGILGRIFNPLYSFEQAKKRAASGAGSSAAPGGGWGSPGSSSSGGWGSPSGSSGGGWG